MKAKIGKIIIASCFILNIIGNKEVVVSNKTDSKVKFAYTNFNNKSYDYTLAPKGKLDDEIKLRMNSNEKIFGRYYFFKKIKLGKGDYKEVLTDSEVSSVNRFINQDLTPTIDIEEKDRKLVLVTQDEIAKNITFINQTSLPIILTFKDKHGTEYKSNILTNNGSKEFVVKLSSDSYGNYIESLTIFADDELKVKFGNKEIDKLNFNIQKTYSPKLYISKEDNAFIINT